MVKMFCGLFNNRIVHLKAAQFFKSLPQLEQHGVELLIHKLVMKIIWKDRILPQIPLLAYVPQRIQMTGLRNTSPIWGRKPQPKFKTIKVIIC